MHFFLPNLHAHGLLLRRRLLPMYVRLKRRRENVNAPRAVHETTGNLELFRLAFLGILELIHVFLELVDLCLGRYLLLLRGFQCCFNLGDRPLKLPDLCADLQSCGGEPIRTGKGVRVKTKQEGRKHAPGRYYCS